MHIRTASKHPSRNSIRVTIPPEVADELGLDGGENVVVRVEKGRVVIEGVDAILDQLE